MYAPHCDLDDSQKDNLFDRLISVIRKVREREIVVITGDFISHVERNPEGLENQHVEVVVMEFRIRKEQRFCNFVL